MVLGKLQVPGRPTNMDKTRAVGAGRGCLDIFTLVYYFIYYFSFSVFLSLRDGLI